MQTLVDTSVWIDYFRSGSQSSDLDFLIDENLVVTNDIILTELIPFLTIKKQMKVISLLRQINKLPLQIDWDEIIQFQHKCLKNGTSGIGISDLLIAQNVMKNYCQIYSLDKHFQILKQVLPLKLHEK